MVQCVSNGCKDLFKRKKDFGAMGTLKDSLTAKHSGPDFFFKAMALQ